MTALRTGGAHRAVSTRRLHPLVWIVLATVAAAGIVTALVPLHIIAALLPWIGGGS